MKNHLSFKLRKIENSWYVVDNLPVFIPVATYTKSRFANMILYDVTLYSNYEEFSRYYMAQLQISRSDHSISDVRYLHEISQFFGNLPNLQFTSARRSSTIKKIDGQSSFTFGKRYLIGENLFIPLAVKLHHACADPFVFDKLLQDFQRRFTPNGIIAI